MMLTDNFNITFIILVFYTLSVGFIHSAKVPSKDLFLVMLIMLSIYYYIKAVKFDNKKSLIVASIFGAILALSSDHIVFLFPAFVLSYIFFNFRKINLKKFKFPNIKYALLPLIIISIFYGSWNAVKFYEYSANKYYPNGVEGAPLSTKDFGLLHLINPYYFEDWEDAYIQSGAISVIKRVIFQMGYMFDLEPFSIPPGLNLTTMKFLLGPEHIVYMFLIYFPLALLALLGFLSIIKDFIRTKKIYENANLYMTGLFFVFLIPLTQQILSPRYIFTSYIFLFYFISYGIFILLMKRRITKAYAKIIPMMAMLLLLLIPFWYYNNGHFILFNKKVVAAQKTANFINSNLDKEDAIMAQQGYNIKLIYLTGHRMVGLYPKPEKLLDVIYYYDIKYVIFGRVYTSYFGLFSTDSVEFIRNKPDKFELVATIPEDYSDFYVEGDPKRTDEVYVYKVKR